MTIWEMKTFMKVDNETLENIKPQFVFKTSYTENQYPFEVRNSHKENRFLCSTWCHPHTEIRMKKQPTKVDHV